MQNFPPKTFTDPSHWKWTLSSSGHQDFDHRFPPSIVTHIQHLCAHIFMVINLLWVTDLLRIWWALYIFSCPPEKCMHHPHPKTQILLFTILKALCIPQTKIPPFVDALHPSPPCPVVSTLTRDISVSHSALLTGPDLGCPHTNVPFIYHPPYFYITPSPWGTNEVFI